MQIRCRHIWTLFKKPDTDFVIARYTADDFEEIEGTFIAKGNNLPTDSYLEVILDGDLRNENDDREPTFIVKSFTASVRKSRANVLGFFTSGAVKGVGYATARLIVDAFGLNAVEILERNPERLKEVKGIGEKTLEMILKSYEDNREIHSLMQYLGQFKISINKAARIKAHFGEAALEIVRNDIYRLCEISGCGYLTVDEMAQKLSQPMDTFARVKAAAEYVLSEMRQDGHLCMKPEAFLTELEALINHNENGYQMPEKLLRKHANKALVSSNIVYSHTRLLGTR